MRGVRKMINGRLFRESIGFADRKAAERRANEIERDIRAGVHGWKSTIPGFAEWWEVYRQTYTPLKSARNRDAHIVAHFLPHFGARRLDDITKSTIVRRVGVAENWAHECQALQIVRWVVVMLACPASICSS